MEFVTISHWDVPNATDDMMDEAKEKFMPMILATGADNVIWFALATTPCRW